MLPPRRGAAGPGPEHTKLSGALKRCATFGQLHRFLQRHMKTMNTLGLLAVQMQLMEARLLGECPIITPGRGASKKWFL